MITTLPTTALLQAKSRVRQEQFAEGMQSLNEICNKRKSIMTLELVSITQITNNNFGVV